ncbi:rod shape-determining protein MreD [Anaerocolumna jejuensis DSM 15929]|uniref:Rod shape-determining protein MreD n=1 Tax=Anaerocolumna jejuensis DSM 15929 TaxID=1121322 RepID=A0A1M6JWM4_9FIRM|nr:rod shape-determining protein MreD [Anaerocolumna jejuensis]SHJ51092.1 rod shape-determining protein MreD [Anaerocolumna jejuensis DSM 15929]
MKRFVIVIAEIFLCFLIQTTIFQWFSLARVAPNLLLILTATAGLTKGRREGLLTGFFCGLLIDLCYGYIVGLYALIFMTIGYLNGFCYRIFVKENMTIPLILVGLSDLVYFFLYYIFEYLLRGKLNIGFYFVHKGLPDLIYTVIISVFLYKLLNIINDKTEKKEEEEGF